VEKPTKKVNVWALALALLLSIIVVLLLVRWAMYERSASTESRQSLAVVSGEITRHKKEVAKCLAMNKETKEVLPAIQAAPCEKGSA